MSKKRFTLSERDLNEINNSNAIADERIPCTQRHIVKLLNELHDENQKLLTLSNIQKRALVEAIKDLTKENEKLKHFREKVFSLIEEELDEHPYLTLTEKWNPNCKNYHSCRGNHEKNVFYASRHTLLEKLREELSYD